MEKLETVLTAQGYHAEVDPIAEDLAHLLPERLEG